MSRWVKGVWQQSGQGSAAAPAESVFHPLAQVKDFAMLWMIFAILLILWLVGVGYQIGGSLVHLLLVIAVLALIVHIVRPNALRRR
jgi:Family of unknown function (DUF5670)